MTEYVGLRLPIDEKDIAALVDAVIAEQADTLDVYEGKQERREWTTVSTWLYPDQRIILI